MKLTTLIAAAGIAAMGMTTALGARAEAPEDLNDLEIAHAAYTADNIDIRYAHLALALSENPAVHEFARTMIRDHTAVNEQALALLGKLDAQPQDNFLSQQLTERSRQLVDEMSALRGAEFDRFYANNEFEYHKAVNDLVANAFIPNIEHPEVKALFEAGLEIFRAHEKHAEMMVEALQ